MPTQSETNLALLRECLSTPILRKAAMPPSPPARGKKGGGAGKPKPRPEVTDSDAEELKDFIDYLSTELFAALPASLQELTSSSAPTPPAPAASCLPPELLDSLLSYRLVEDAALAESLLLAVITEYISAATAPPPVWSQTRREECEICERRVPLTYHHLIPREVHKKVLKRGWHDEDMLGSVAWLCRPCHSFVHKVASNEELAREWWSVERLLEREDVNRWRAWVGRQRW